MTVRYPEVEQLTERYPQLGSQELIDTIVAAIDLLCEAYERAGTLLVCGNGGSAADADHIVGELMKNFLQDRPIGRALQDRLKASEDPKAAQLLSKLQGAFPALNLTAQTALISAYSNDIDPAYAYAQQVAAYGRPGDVLLAISTSGTSENIVNAAATANFLAIPVIALTGGGDSSKPRIGDYSDITIKVPARSTNEIQELHMPVYHTICAAVERLCFTSVENG